MFNWRFIAGDSTTHFCRIPPLNHYSRRGTLSHIHYRNGALTCGAFLNALNDIYESKPIARRKSIKGLIQAAKIALYFIMGIVVIAILINKDPTQLLVGLGASAAILSLVFKDTILGFIASIQISAQDTVRPETGSRCLKKGLTVLLLTLMSHTSRCATGTIR